jgi:hypothetical protein
VFKVEIGMEIGGRWANRIGYVKKQSFDNFG